MDLAFWVATTNAIHVAEVPRVHTYQQVKAVIECFDFDLDVVDDKTELVLGPQQKIVVKGNIKDVLDTVRTFSKGMTIACQGKKS